MENINILIVDDKIENLVALEALIDRKDVNIISTTLPNEALRISWEKDIAIALVDVQMPEMDGFELVEILKSNPRTKDILVIFVTAISVETKYAVRGLAVGAVDYLYKPLNPYITSAKVDSFIQIVRNQREIKAKNSQLEAYQKKLIKAKEEAEQGRRIKENFLANMSHEIRTPINGIIGLSNVLLETQLTESQKHMIELMKISSDSLLRIINDVLDLSKMEAGKFKIIRTETNLAQLGDNAINLLSIGAKDKKIELKLILDPQLPQKVMADSLRLNQILINLMGNAIKFTQQGSVTLKIDVIDKKGNNMQIKFSIIDTGIGIAKENINKVFEMFEQGDDQTTLKFGGTGLGLSIVKNLAKLKGGHLSVESEINKGSTFSFANWYEVVKTVNPRESVPLKPNYFAPLPHVKILVAEDNVINKFLIEKLLKDWSINFDVVENGKDALVKLAENQYDLILMDNYMPIMSGLQAITLIRQGEVPGKENIPIVVFSAATMESDKVIAMEAGANGILSKSFDSQLLYNTITSYIKK
ncbi:response regulator [Pedobacter sp. LMG 31464]|uniref:Sensory/regulatory protein RpfC n=1 Tax=Pedobacter planticolens TaxID=2679964 RepID=A0A923E213_9SPHI|nr:response regulator [Pedobacter planticolens]MBB2146948.1 response regulator [Pedobacter planticolens]